MNPKKWLHEHSLKLLAIRDTPEAIAGGVAIGFFFGFVPLFGLKTLLAIFFAWLTGCNILAAVIAGVLHDVVLPFMPMIYLYEFKVGYWMLHHEWVSLSKLDVPSSFLGAWRTFVTLGKPLLLGSLICSAPFAALSFFVTQRIIIHHRRKKAAHEETPVP